MKKNLLLISMMLAISMVFGQLSGTKTIPGDYATIEAAIFALNAQGVGSGGVTFNVAAGHTETFTTPSAGLITAIGTTSNQIVFQKSGAGSNPVITAATPGIGTMDFVICLSGADYVTIDGIDILENAANTTSTTQMEWAYAVLKASEINGSQNNTIKNCNISLDPSNTSSRAVYSNNHTTSATTQLVVTDIAGTNSNNKFFGLNVSNCYHAFYIYGRADVDYYDQNNELGVDGANTVNGLGNTGATAATYGLYCYYQTGIKIANNTFTGTCDNVSGSMYAMYLMTSTNANVDVYNNTVSMTYNGTGSFYALYNSGMGSSGTTNTVNYYNNQIINNSVPNHTSGTIYLIYISTGGVTANFYNNNVSNNLIGSASATSTGSIYYTYFASSPSSTGVTSVYNNIVYNNRRTQSTLGGGANYMFYNSGSSGGADGVANVYGNTVDEITVGSSGTSYGFYNLMTSGVKNFYNNSITNIQNANGTTYGFYNSSGTVSNFYNNKIQNLNQNNTSGTLYGFYIGTVTTCNMYNNYISELYAPQLNGATSIHGIYVSGGTSHGIYNNTVYLNASSSGSDFGTCGIYASTTPTVELRNNIVINLSTPGTNGYTVAYRRSSTTIATYASTSNNNDFYAGTPGPNRLIFYDGTNADQTLGEFQARVSPADASSITENPPFVNVSSSPYNLHLLTNVPTQIESGGATVSTPANIIDDFDGDARYPNAGYPDNPSSPASAPDIGADEFGGLGTDLTPPAIIFAPLENTSSTVARTLLTTITDASGVPTLGVGLPVLYWKVNSGSYTGVTATWLGGDQYSFTFGSGVVIGDVVSYYLVAQDMASPTVNIGAMPSGGAAGFTPNPPACSTPPDPPLSYTILGSICGTYQVGTGQTYATITQAIADLAQKEVTCPVVFELTDAAYGAETLPITVPYVVGASAGNTITFRPAAGVNATISGESATSIFKFTGGRYFIIDGSNVPGGNSRNLTIENTTTSTNSAVVWFSSQGSNQGSTDNTIKNCQIIGGSNTVTSQFGIYLAGATISTSGTGADNDGITLENNKISRAYYGIFAQGLPSVGELDNLVIKDNLIGGDIDTDYITGYGMRLQSVNGGMIYGNEVYNMIYDGSKYGIYMGTYISNTVFANNTIHAMGQTNSTATYYCIAMYFSSSTGASNNKVINNTIYDLYNYGSTSNFYGPIGIRIVGGSNYQLYHNSISLTGAFGSTTAGVYSHCLFVSTATNNMDLRNNIFHNTLTGNDPRAYTVYTPNTSSFSPINYNDYFSTGSAIGYYGAEVANFAAWQLATGQDANSVNINPAFISTTDLHPTNMALNNLGTYLAVVPKDFDGVNRTNPPDMGAYEFGVNPQVQTLPATDVTATAATLNGSVNAAGEVVATYFDYGLTTDYGNTVTGTPASISGTTTTAYSADLTGLPTWVVYHYRARGVTSLGLTVYGDDMTFETVPPPVVTTTAATAITQNGATLNGIVNANNATATVTFEYGPTDSYGFTVTADQSPVTGNTDTPVSLSITGLNVYSLYHFRVVATTSNGSTYGNDLTFTTLGAPPVVVTNPASNVLQGSAQLNGTVTANNQATTVTFEWGETTAYGNVITATPATVNGMAPTAVMAMLNGLGNNMVYHYRCVGVNAEGTTYGADQWFNTYCPPPAPAGPISGPASVCVLSVGHVYSVAPIADATDYIWTVPAGAVITAGANTPSITVSFGETAVSGDVSVYGSSNCGIGVSSSLAVTVNPLAEPTITGPDVTCLNSTYTYTTEAGMTNYQWAVSAGGQIMSGSGTHSITVKWNSTGDQSVSATYTSAAGCPAVAPAVLDVTVGDLPSPSISGSNLVCVNTGLHVYTTQQGFSDYNWTVSSGGSIASGQGTYQVEVNWTGAGNQTVTVNYSNIYGCSAPAPASFSLVVTPLPGSAGSVTGTPELCEGTQGVSYSVAPIANALNYIWEVPAGATIVEGMNTNSIKVDFAEGAESGIIRVYGENLCGYGQPSPAYEVSVYAIPPTPVASVDEFFVLHSSAPEGNQWYLDGTPVEGATGQDYQAEEEGMYYTIVTLNGCESEPSNEVDVIFTGVGEPDGSSFSIFPVPNDGRFTATIIIPGKDTFTIRVYSDLGVEVYEKSNLSVDGKIQHSIDLNNPGKGVYTVVFTGNKQTVIRKVLVTK